MEQPKDTGKRWVERGGAHTVSGFERSFPFVLIRAIEDSTRSSGAEVRRSGSVSATHAQWTRSVAERQATVIASKVCRAASSRNTGRIRREEERFCFETLSQHTNASEKHRRPTCSLSCRHMIETKSRVRFLGYFFRIFAFLPHFCDHTHSSISCPSKRFAHCDFSIKVEILDFRGYLCVFESARLAFRTLVCASCIRHIWKLFLFAEHESVLMIGCGPVWNPN